MRRNRSIIVGGAALALGTLACGLGGTANQLQQVQEQAQAVQEQAESIQQQAETMQEQAESAQDQAEPAQDQAEAVPEGIFGDECPVATADEIQAAFGSSIVASTTVDVPTGMQCSIALEGDVYVQIQVPGIGSQTNTTDTYQSLVNNAVGEGTPVDGPWEEGMYFSANGLMFRTATNVVWINLPDNQDAAVQLGMAVAGHLPYTPGG